MSSMIKFLSVCSLVVSLFSQSSSVSAADKQKLEGLGVSAFFSDLDSTGCITTSTAVFVTENSIRSADTHERTTTLFVDVSQNNICTDTALISASGQMELADGAFDIRNNLATATLDSTITLVNNITDQPIDLDLHLAWTATSSVLSQSGHSKFSFDKCHFQVVSDADFRFATATGTVLYDTLNLTPSPSTNADLQNSREGDFSHGCD